MTPLRLRMLEDMQVRNLSPTRNGRTSRISLGLLGTLVGRRQTSVPRRFAPIRCIWSASDGSRPRVIEAGHTDALG
jgi:hypothetical protein